MTDLFIGLLKEILIQHFFFIFIFASAIYSDHSKCILVVVYSPGPKEAMKNVSEFGDPFSVHLFFHNSNNTRLALFLSQTSKQI